MIYSIGVLFLAAYISSSAALPPCVCTRNLKPVCGTDGNTYNNECLLECARTKRNPDLAVERLGPCVAAAPMCICTLEYMPVCGSDGVTYPNSCALDCQARTVLVEKVHNGNCVEKKVKRDTEFPDIDASGLNFGRPPCTCARNMNPVCGSDGEDYPNTCVMKCANPQLTVARFGFCDGSMAVVVGKSKKA